MARADLAEDWVMLVWNNHNQDSEDIAEEYLELHPNVISCDLDIEYTTDFDLTPPECGITSTYITPCKFREVFLDGPSNFTACLAANPNILCIVTTRGVPAAISNTLTPTLGVANDIQPNGGIYASVDAALSRLRFGPLGEGPDDIAFDKVPNPYNDLFPSSNSAAPYFFQPIINLFDAYPYSASFCGPLDDDDLPGQPLCPGEIFAVSRLDSAAAPNLPIYDVDQDGVVDAVDGVLRMLRRSQEIEVNKYAVTALFDTSPEWVPPPTAGAANPAEFASATITVWNDCWVYMYDQTAEFIHGPTDPNADSATDGPFTRYPIISLVTWGRHHEHSGQEPISAAYVSYYNPHPGGVFISRESYNGWSMHQPGVYGNSHGQVLDWIGAGGGFAIGNIAEPVSPSEPEPRVLLKTFLVGKLMWGEAALASLPYLGQFQTPIGDPLAVIVSRDPDITGPAGDPDRIVDHYDLGLVNSQFGQSGHDLKGDINEDGTVNQLDRNFVRDAYGRNTNNPPEVPEPGAATCGDVNQDGFVDEADFDLFDDYILLIGGYQPCPLLESWNSPCLNDLDGDGHLTEDDPLVIEAHEGLCFDYDLTNNGIIDFTDASCFLAFYTGSNIGDPNYDPQLDYNCDDKLDGKEFGQILNHFGLAECQSPEQQGVCDE